MKSYPLGNALVFTTTFLDTVTKQPVNPTAVICRLRQPGGDEIDPSFTNPSIGVFQATYTPTLSGIWTYRWEGTGVVEAAVENQFEVQPSEFTDAG